MFKFKEGDTVVLKHDSPGLGLTAGDVGAILALYDTLPRSYEVMFRPRDGDEFSMVSYEDEIAKPERPAKKAGWSAVHKGTPHVNRR